MAAGRPSISEVVAEVVLIMVTLSVGSVVLTYVLSQSSAVTSRHLNEQEYLGYVTPITATAIGGKVYLVVDTGPLGADLEQVLAGATPLQCNYTAIGPTGQELAGRLPFNAPANAIATITCGLPSSATEVYLVTNVGEVSVYVSP